MSEETLARYVESTTASQSAGPPIMRQRYRGVLLGVAVGNALGIPAEGHSRRHIAERFTDGLREVRDSEREAPWDDDLAQTALLAEAIVERERLDLADLGGRMVRWLRDNGRGCGNLTYAVIREIASGTPATDTARRVWERLLQQYGDGPAGNGAVMRCSPLALRWRRRGMRLIEETRASALVTHYDPRCVWSAVAINAALVRCLNGAPLGLDELASHLDEAGAPSDVASAVRAARGCSMDDLALDGQDMGYTLKAMQVGLWAMQQEATIETILVQVVNAGGDTDTNGAVVGAMLGAREGISAIPSRWLTNIRDTDRLVTLADRLLEASLQDGS